MGSLPAPKAISPLTAARKPLNRVGAGAADGLVPAVAKLTISAGTGCSGGYIAYINGARGAPVEGLN